MKIRHLFNTLMALMLPLLMSSCIMEDIQQCPNDYYLKMVFDRNMLYTDAFAAKVKSVNIKVFDHTTGRMVYQYAESGDALQEAGYRVALPIPPGTYDILCWGGMAEGDSFSFANSAAEILEHHNVVLNTEEGVSGNLLNDLFHGLLTEAIFIDNNTIGSKAEQVVTVSLTKNTNLLNVVLHNLDGTEISESDFTVRILSENAEMAHDNNVSAKRSVEYKPFHINPVFIDNVDVEDETQSRALTQAALTAEFSLGRLMKSGNSRLEVIRHSDNKTIISVPLERNLLLYKGKFHSSMENQEYFDRRDDYSITFILDKNNNWNRAAMIMIEDWATPPVQYEEW